jgi:hypothetical protein
VGGALIGACSYFSNLPFSIYTKSEYWLNSPALPLTKLGVTLALLAFAYVWTRHTAGAWSWVRQLDDVAAGVMGADRAGIRAVVRASKGKVTVGLSDAVKLGAIAGVFWPDADGDGGGD